MNRYIKPVFYGVVALLLLACSEQQPTPEVALKAVAIESSDECHLCGMIISNFSGPKGELYRQQVSQEQSNQVMKFCSTRDLLSYYLDPENTRNVTAIWVHDMSKMPWETTDDEFFIDAKEAWFVAGSSKNGAMGKTLASFSLKKDAEEFINSFGGYLLSFEQISTEILMEQ